MWMELTGILMTRIQFYFIFFIILLMAFHSCIGILLEGRIILFSIRQQILSAIIIFRPCFCASMGYKALYSMLFTSSSSKFNNKKKVVVGYVLLCGFYFVCNIRVIVPFESTKELFLLCKFHFSPCTFLSDMVFMVQ